MATANKTKTPPAAGPADKGLRVQARHPQGMRRAGRHWPAEGVTVSLADLSEEQLEAIEGEPGLMVARVDMPASA